MADLSNVVRMLIHRLDATRSYLLPGYCDEDEKARAVIAFAESALAAEPPAPAEPSDFQALQGIALDMVESLRPIVLPEILGVLRRAIKQPPAPAPAADGERDHVPDAGNMVAADGEAEELATLLAIGSSCAAGAKLSPEQCRRAAALLREARPQPVPGWQPIDTAPHDGSEILASDYDAIEIVSWDAWETGSGWIDRNGQRLFPAWWQPLPDHPPIPQPPQGGEVES